MTECVQDSSIHVTPVIMSPIASRIATYVVARRIRRATRAAGVMACVLALLQACSGSDAIAPISPSNAGPIGQVAGTAIVGATLDAPVRLSVTAVDNKPLSGVTVRWNVANGGRVSSAETTTDGMGVASVRWTLGTTAGLQSLTANVVGLPPVIFGANAVADRAATIRFANDIARLTLLGDTVRYAASVTDRFGNPVAALTTTTLESTNDVIVAAGDVFIAKNRGSATIKFTADTATARLSIIVDTATPVVTGVSPDTLTPGATISIDGTGFALTPESVDLNVAGVKVAVTKVTASRIEATLPTTYGCLATGLQPVHVTIATATGQRAVPFRTATRIALAKGQSVTVLDATQVRCTELVAPVGNANAKYMFAVINTSVSAATTSGFELRGVGVGAMAGQTATPKISMQAAVATSGATIASNPRLAAAMAQLATEDVAEGKHNAYLESQRALNARFGSPAPTWRAIAQIKAMNRLAASRAPVSVGDTIPMKALYSSCSAGRDIKARVVYAGTKSLVLEDIAAPRAGTMDDQYRLIGDEFDRVQYPLLQSKVGDPLAMNDAMQGDGRLTMLFTRYVNDSLPGIAGYVSACNFYSKGTFAASNEDEVFYARVANAGESPAEWRRGMRSTIVHEGKHLASFAIRFVNGTPFEESWLEESLGRVAEELYARTFANSGSWKGNVGYDNTVRCEVYQCDDRPLMMWKHFSVLHQYLRGVDTLTPIGAAANGDFTFYASGWSLVRWAIDQYATDEISGIKDLVRGGQLTGLSNLSQRTGRPAGEMLADWALANAVDDIVGFTPERKQLTFPSWNVADVFSGLATTYPGSFVAAPLKARAMTFGSFSLPVTKLRAFSSSYFSFEGAQMGNQLVELRGEGGVSVPPGSLRVAVVRVE